MTVASADWAVRTASELLEHELPARWRHVAAAIAKAEAFAPAVSGEEGVLVAAVALHDVGFAPAAQDTGYSTLDAVRWLQGAGAEQRLVGLVANQSCSWIEASERGYGEHWAGLPADEGGAVRDAMWTCCLTTATDGGSTTVAARCAEWLDRYDATWLRPYLQRAQPELEAAERRTRERMSF